MGITLHFSPPIKQYLDGVIVVVHDASPDDPGVKYLESVKGEGEIILRKFVYRHWHSMNETLFTGRIQNGDVVMWIDTDEFCPPHFAATIKTEWYPFMINNQIDLLSFMGKPYLFIYNEGLQYVCSPHWTLIGYHRAFALEQLIPEEKDARINLRYTRRTEPRWWVKHNARYFIEYPAGSNSAMLGLEKNGDVNKLFPIVEQRRLEFREILRKRGIPVRVKSVVELLESGPLDDEIKPYFNQCKELNDLYRHVVLKDMSFPDDHDFNNKVKID